MKNTEKITTVLFFLALLFKILNIPGADILLILSIVILSLIYYPFGFAFFNQIKLRRIFNKASYDGISTKKIIGAVFFGIILSTICIGILFKILMFPGGTIILTIGTISAIAILTFSIIRYVSSKHSFHLFFIKRAIIITVIGIIVYLTPHITLIKWQFKDHPAYIEAYAEYLKDMDNVELKMKRDIEYYRATLTDKEFQFWMEFELPRKYPRTN